MECEYVNLFGAELNSEIGFADWGKKFCQKVEKNGFNKNILVGYSLGARLGMSALASNKALFYKSILISGNPGFDDAYEELDTRSEPRRLRWIQDAKWADRFLKSPWSEVVMSWNAQPVFQGGVAEPQRLEKDYNRELLALALTQWSLAQQPNMRKIIGDCSDRILWIVGELDERYRQIGTELKTQFNKLKVLIASGASHRVPLEKPEYIAELIEAIART